MVLSDYPFGKVIKKVLDKSEILGKIRMYLINSQKSTKMKQYNSFSFATFVGFESHPFGSGWLSLCI